MTKILAWMTYVILFALAIVLSPIIALLLDGGRIFCRFGWHGWAWEMTEPADLWGEVDTFLVCQRCRKVGQKWE